MKNLDRLLLSMAFAAAAVACSDEEAKNDSLAITNGNVQFVTRTVRLSSSRRQISVPDDFRILAFKNNGSAYTYMRDIPIDGMNFDGTTLSGSAQLPAGEYKFLPSCGLNTATHYTWPALDGAVLSDELFLTHTGESFPEAFMLNMPLENVPSYTVSLDGPKQTVKSTLRRSVSRVDVLFIRAEKNAADGTYIEKAGSDIFGPEKLGEVKLSFTDANSRLGLSGEKVPGVFNVTNTIQLADAVTMGIGASTIVGTDNYDFENMQSGDIISGSAHLKGTYLIPNVDNTAATGCTISLTSGEGSTRTITLTDKIPVERNKITLIRIYVLGDNVFTTSLDFEVEVDTVWDGSNFVDEEID